MITKEEFIDLIIDSVLFDGSTEYKQVAALAKQEGLRLSNAQVWHLLDEAKGKGLTSVDW
jgi:hypothetical protein